MAERRWFRRPDAAASLGLHGSAPAKRPARGRYKLSDAVLTGVGIGIGIASFTFPWYVFMNQERFGVAALRFDSADGQTSDLSGPFYTPRVRWNPQPLTEEEIMALQIDLLPTGTVRGRDVPPAGDGTGGVPVRPVSAPAFSLVHVANGRAMIRDANGLWVVERGSVLPDSSRVVAIEQRNGTWVLRTSADAVIELTR